MLDSLCVPLFAMCANRAEDHVPLHPHFGLGPRRCLLCSACMFPRDLSPQLDTAGIGVTSSTCMVNEGESAEIKVSEAWGPVRTIV